MKQHYVTKGDFEKALRKEGHDTNTKIQKATLPLDEKIDDEIKVLKLKTEKQDNTISMVGIIVIVIIASHLGYIIRPFL